MSVKEGCTGGYDLQDLKFSCDICGDSPKGECAKEFPTADEMRQGASGDSGLVSRDVPSSPVARTSLSGKCPRCQSPAKHLHPAMQYEGEVQLCEHGWHEPTATEIRDIEKAKQPADFLMNVTRQELADVCAQAIFRLECRCEIKTGFTISPLFGLEIIRLLRAASAPPIARPLAEWHDDMGDVLWWKFPVNEPPYCGSPLDSDWPDYHTHWTPIVVPGGYVSGAHG